MKEIAEEDLLQVYHSTNHIWESLRNKNILLTGGTGFFGKWLLQSFYYINQKIALKAKIYILSRNPEQFVSKFPLLRDSHYVHFLKGDVLSYDYDLDIPFHYIIHAATAASDAINKSDPLLMVDTITIGTRKILDFASKQPLLGFLFVSSGAVYGKQPSDVERISEDSACRIDINNYRSAYAEGKRIAELYCSIYHQKFGLPVKIARCFAFVGPYLPLNSHFAVGNFISNVLAGENIVIKSDGSTVRSYMYASDLTAWLWSILINGRVNVPYNVGSDQGVSVLQLAQLIKNLSNSDSEVQILGNKVSTDDIDIYIPCVNRIKRSLDVNMSVSLEQGILKTVKFHRQNGK